MSGVYPRKHVDLIISLDGETRIEPFEFVPEDGQDPWGVIRAKQNELFADGATGVNTCNYRTLLDIDGHRD